jgi:hypothetical protein
MQNENRYCYMLLNTVPVNCCVRLILLRYKLCILSSVFLVVRNVTVLQFCQQRCLTEGVAAS